MTAQDIAERLRAMARNLAQALDGLNDNRRFPIPPGIDMDILYAADGSIFATPGTPPHPPGETPTRGTDETSRLGAVNVDSRKWKRGAELLPSHLSKSSLKRC